MRGRRPELKAIEGGLLRTPAMPKTLPAEMASAWRLTCADLMGRGLLTNAVVPLVETYVGALWMAGLCRAAIAEQGVTVRAKDMQLKPHPAMAALAKAQEAIARLGDDLGLSPTSRNRPGIKAAEKAPDDDDASRLGL